MIACTIICTLLGIYSASTSKIDVTLNLSRPSKDHFRKESQDLPNYNQCSFYPKDCYNIANLIDSGIDIWTSEDEVILNSVDVYYKDYVPQLLILNFSESLNFYSDYYARDNGRFTKIDQSRFSQLEQSSSFIDLTLVLDLQKGFCHKYFYESEAKIEDITFEQYRLKEEFNLVRFTDGSSTLVDTSAGQTLGKILHFQVDRDEELFRVTTVGLVRGEIEIHYHLKNDSLQLVTPTQFKKLCLSLLLSVSAKELNSSYLSDDGKCEEEEWYYDSLSELKDLNKPQDCSSESGSSIHAPQTFSEVDHRETDTRSNDDESSKGSQISGSEEGESLVSSLRKQFESLNQYPRQVPIPAPRKIPTPAPRQTPIPAPRKILPTAPSEAPTPAPRQTPIPAPRKILPTAPSEAPTPAPRQAPIPAPRKTPIPAPRQRTVNKERAAELRELEAEKAREEREAEGKKTTAGPSLSYSEKLYQVNISQDPFYVSPQVKESEELQLSDLDELEKEVKVLEEMRNCDQYGTSDPIASEDTKSEPPKTCILDDEALDQAFKEAEEELARQGLSQPILEDEPKEAVFETRFNDPGLESTQVPDTNDPIDCDCGSKFMKNMFPHVVDSILEEFDSIHDEKLDDASVASLDSKSTNSDEVTLFLDADDDESSFEVTVEESVPGYVVKLYRPRGHNLVAVKNTLPLWVADLNEVRCTEARVHRYFSDTWALKLTIELSDGSHNLRFFNPNRFNEITKEEYESLIEDLANKTTEPEPKGIPLTLEYSSQPNVHVQVVSPKLQTPYTIYAAYTGYGFISVHHNQKVLWKADKRYPCADTATYYTHLDRPAYLVLNFPTTNYFTKELTIDLVKMKKVSNLSELQLRYLLDNGTSDRHVPFNFSDPINTETYKVSKASYNSFIIRNFTARQRRVVTVYDNKTLVTPTNIIPFADFKVYYYKNYPVLILTDPYLGPSYFARFSSGWRATVLSEMNNNLEEIKRELDDTSMHPRTFLYLDYDLLPDKNFLVETGKQNYVPYKSIFPVLGNIVSNIYCSQGFVLKDSDRRTSSGVKFFLKNGEPYKAELLLNARAGLKKMVFKILDQESGKWLQVDESVFETY